MDTESMADANGSLADAESFDYSPWRHGGWYVNNVRYPNGAVGCVSRNYADKKWRIACDPRPFDEQPTFRTRDEAAAAELEMIRAAEPAAKMGEESGVRPEQRPMGVREAEMRNNEAPPSGKARHTPGPWRVGNAGRGVFSPTTPHLIADCDTRANARLIAAAPDLLSVLKDLEQCVTCYMAGGLASLPSRLLPQAREAIRKAEGAVR